MSGMDDYARKQVIINNLEFSLRDLHKQRTENLSNLVKIDKQIEKHIAFLKKLKNEED